MTEVTLRVSNTTPLLTGWYDPDRVDPQGLRATEIKGIWRWWARAIIGGSLYDKRMLIGEGGHDIIRKPSRVEASLINCLVGRILGLGYTSPEGSESSRFTLIVDPIDSVRISELEIKKEEEGRHKRRIEYQRLNLLTLKKEDKKIKILRYIDPGHEFKITVKRIRTRYTDAEDLALRILILALQLQGLGKGARRGLGSLDIMDITGINIPKGLGELINTIYESALNIVERYSGECKQSIVRSFDKPVLPPIPVISKSSYQGNSVASIYVIEGVADLGGFRNVHNFFVRTERCRVLHRSPICYDMLRRTLQAWILGLPRSQRDPRIKTDTGYIVKGEVNRRASPIMISYHSKDNLFGSGVFVTFTMSGDWPRKLEWVRVVSDKQGRARRKGQPLSLNEQDIVQAMRTAFREFKDYIGRLGYRMVGVWP